MNSLSIEQAQGQSASFIYDWVLAKQNQFQLDRVLDVGAGKGFFLKQLSAPQKTGADALPRPLDLDSQVQWVQIDLNENWSSQFQSGFTTTFAIEVIEHLENPRHFLRQIFQCLEPGGRVCLTTPNIESFRSLLSFAVRGHHVDFLDSSYPAHITALVRKDIERMLHECGFQILEVSYSNRGAVPGMTFMTWQQLSLGLLRGRRFSDNLMVIAERRK